MELQQALQEAEEKKQAYDYQDGMAYGYTLAVTQNGEDAGQAGSGVAMFLYAGERNGVYQLHKRDGNLITAIECTYPCKVLKVMVAADDVGILNVQHFRPEPNAVASLALRDAHNGYLKRYGIDKDKRRYGVWVDAQEGIILTPLAE